MSPPECSNARNRPTTHPNVAGEEGELGGQEWGKFEIPELLWEIDEISWGETFLTQRDAR